MKKKLLFFVLLLLFFSQAFPMTTTEAANSSKEEVNYVNILVNGNLSSTKGIVYKNTTMVPIRAVGNLLGLKVKWDQSNQMVTLSNSSKKITIRKEGAVTINNQVMFTSQPFINKKKTVYVPLRFISESLSSQVTFNKAKKLVSISTIKENNMVVYAKHITYYSNYLNVFGQYPQILGLKDKLVEQKINEVLARHVQYLKQMTDNKFTAEEKNWLQTEKMKYEYLSDYQIQYNQKNMISILFNDYNYTGGAHGFYSYTSYTFDILTGKQIQLQELFDSTQNHINVINQEIAAQTLKYNKYYLFGENPYIVPEHDRFYINKAGKLVIYFDLYEFTPYSEGIPSYNMPFKINNKR